MSTYNDYLDFLQHTDNNSRQEVEKKINGLQDDIKALKSSLNTLQKDRDRISDDLAKTKKAMNDKEDELNMKSVEIESMLKKQKEKDNENKKLLEEQARKSEKKISELKSQNEQRFSELQKQSNKDKGLLEQLREEKAALQKERDKLSSKLAQQNSTNETDKQALNKQLESEKQTVKRLEDKIRSLNEEQEQLLGQLKAGAEEKGGENTQEVLFWKQKYEAANQALTDLKAEQNVSAQQIAEFKQALDQKDSAPKIIEQPAKASSRNWIWGAISAVAIIIIFVMGGLYAQSQKTISDMEEKEKTYLNAFTHFIENPNSFTPDNIVSLTYLEKINKLIYSLKERGKLPTESGEHFFYGFVCEKLAYMEPEEAIKRQYMKEAAEWYESAANNVASPYTRAKVALGKLYQKGYMMEPNIDKAIQLYREAAEAGDADAMSRLVDMRFDHIHAEIGEPSWDEIKRLGKMAAENGNPLGLLLYQNYFGYRPFHPMDSIGFDRLIESAEKGCARALWNLGEKYESGDSLTPKNMNTARLLYNLADEKYKQKIVENDDEAMCDLARMGEGVHCGYERPNNYKELLKEAAIRGNAKAQFLIGMGYLGVYPWWVEDRNHDEGIKWLKESAKRGHKEAKESLEEYNKVKLSH